MSEKRRRGQAGALDVKAKAETSPVASRLQARRALKFRDTARSTDAHEVCGEDLAYEVDALAAAVADLVPIVARLARAGR